MPELPHEQQTSLQVWIERAWRFCCQRPKDKSKLYALHAPEAECIGKGKARQPYEFGVKVSLAIIERHGLIVGARRFQAIRTTAMFWPNNWNRPRSCCKRCKAKRA